MKQEMVRINRLSNDDLCFLAKNTLDKILNSSTTITKAKIIDAVANLRDEIDRYS